MAKKKRTLPQIVNEIEARRRLRQANIIMDDEYSELILPLIKEARTYLGLSNELTENHLRKMGIMS